MATGEIFNFSGKLFKLPLTGPILRICLPPYSEFPCAGPSFHHLHSTRSGAPVTSMPLCVLPHNLLHNPTGIHSLSRHQLILWRYVIKLYFLVVQICSYLVLI